MSKKEKIIIVVLCVWSFIHTYLLLTHLQRFVLDLRNGNEVQSLDLFYPFTLYWGQYTNLRIVVVHNFDLRFYDYTEYFIYVVGAWMLYFLLRFLKKK